MREEIEAYLKTAKTRPVSLNELAVDLWYPERMRVQSHTRFAQEALPVLMEMVGEGVVVESERDGEKLYWLAAYQKEAEKRKKAALDKLRKPSTDLHGKPAPMAKHAPIFIH